MGQTTLGDDEELFGEAASEAREEVREHVRAARSKLPTAEAVWETDANNVLGALNGLSAALDTGEAVEELRQARKRYVLAERAGAFDGDDELSDELEELTELVETLETARERVGELTTTVPQLRGELQEVHEAAADTDADADEAEA